jgi:predicted phosphatase
VIQTQKNDLDSFIDASTAVQVQQIFEKMIVVWPWKDRMLTAWNLR